MKILLIDNYDSFTYNLFHYLSSLKCKVDVYRNDKIQISKIKKKKYNKIVISPGPGNPSQSGNCLKIVKHFYKTIPILGVCLGHQAIGSAFGAEVVQAGEIMHGKTSPINHDNKGVFAGLAQDFDAIRYHSLVLEKTSIPDEISVTATTPSGLIMGIRHKNLPIEGVQFHPEFRSRPLNPHPLFDEFISVASKTIREGDQHQFAIGR